jgi:hypothetical protein
MSSKQLDLQIESFETQQKAFLRLSRFLFKHFTKATVTPVKQGLHLHAFEKRDISTNGKYAAKLPEPFPKPCS